VFCLFSYGIPTVDICQIFCDITFYLIRGFVYKRLGDAKMESITIPKAPRPVKVVKKIDEEAAIMEANGFIIEHLPDRFCAGAPKMVEFPVRKVWAVPILLSYPRIGPVGEAGIIAVDAEIGTVVGWTPLEEVIKAAQKIYSERKEEIEAAFS
jgi:hypothetical protein